MAFQIEFKTGKEGGYAVVSGYDGDVRRLIVPARFEGRPVKKIASHAFAERREIEELYLPDTLDEIGSYAFYNMSSLKKLSFSDGVEDFDDGAIRMLKNLKELELFMPNGNWRLLKYMLNDTEDSVHVHLHLPDGQESWLYIPGYSDVVREDTFARAIHRTIEGPGFTYRQCVSREGIDFLEYDRAFSRAAMANEKIAEIISLDRLMYPVKLVPSCKERYMSYASEHASEFLVHSAEERRLDALDYLTGNMTFDRGVLTEALDVASREQFTEGCAVLMDAIGRLGGGQSIGSLLDDDENDDWEDFL